VGCGVTIETTLKEFRGWDDIPKQLESFTPEMADLVLDLAEEVNAPNVHVAAMADWFIVGLHAGIRKSEWAQSENSQTNLLQPKLNECGDTEAFCIN
jgi:hypothetical protein